MSFDLSTLWSGLASITTGLNDFFNSIFASVSAITNTGQGIFSGLATFGSSVWDAIIKFGASLATGFLDSLNALGGWFYTGLNSLGTFIFNTFSSIPSALYSAFQWLYNGVLYVINSIVAFFAGVVNFFVSVVSSVWTTLVSVFTLVPNSVNSYFDTLVLTWRAKMKLLIINNATIEAGWNGITGLKDNFTPKGIASAIFSPLIGAISGAFFAELLDNLMPSTTLAVKIIPVLDIPTPTFATLAVGSTFGALAEPSPPAPPSGPSVGFGLPLDATTNSSTSKDLTLMTTDEEPLSDASAETSSDSSDADITSDLSTETSLL